MSTNGESRIGAARERAAAAKVLLAGGAVGVFGVVLALARTSHPASAQSSTRTGSASSTPAVVQQQSDALGGGSIGPVQPGFSGPSAGTATS